MDEETEFDTVKPSSKDYGGSLLSKPRRLSLRIFWDVMNHVSVLICMYVAPQDDASKQSIDLAQC